MAEKKKSKNRKIQGFWKYLMMIVISFVIIIAAFSYIPAMTFYTNSIIDKGALAVDILKGYSKWYGIARILIIVLGTGYLGINIYAISHNYIEYKNAKKAGEETGLSGVFMTIAAILAIAIAVLVAYFKVVELTERQNLLDNECMMVLSDNLYETDAKILVVKEDARLPLGMNSRRSPAFVRVMTEGSGDKLYIPYSLDFDTSVLKKASVAKKIPAEEFDDCELYRIRYSKELNIVFDIKKAE